MKKYIVFRMLIIVMIFTINGCNKDFLEKYPPDKLSEGTFYKTKEDAIAAINAAYDPLQKQGMYGRDAIRWGAKTEELYRAGDFYNCALYLPTNSETNQGYFNAFQGVLFANTVFKYIPEMEIDGSLKTKILGEAAFLRAFYYYFLVRWYGDVPIITTVPTAETNFNVPRDPSKAVYQQVIDDFLAAINNLPEKSDLTGENVGRASKGAARAMLADVYLYLAAFNNMDTQYYSKVRDLCLEIINSGQYKLESNYNDIYDITTENGKESVFEVQFAKGFNEGSWNVEHITTWNSTTVNPAFYDSWNSLDKRRAACVILPGETVGDYTNTSTFIHQKKTITGKVNAAGPGGGSGFNSPRNLIVQRYASVLLTYAEAINELNSTPPSDAISFVNSIRNRAGLSDLSLAITSSKTAFREAVRTERKYELAYEGYRWFDLIRYEKMGLGGGLSDILLNPSSPYYNASIKLPQHFLFPIPQSELDANPNLTQNLGY